MSIIANGLYKVNNKTELNSAEFQRIRKMVYDYCGINLHEGKEALVKGRLMKRLRILQLQTFTEYLDYIDRDDSDREFFLLIDILTTNKTSFFRESSHFDFIGQEVIPTIGNRPVKWWSAGCSTGEEPVTMGITLKEESAVPKTPPVKILATDLSVEVIQFAKKGIYTKEKLDGVPNYLIHKHFKTIPGAEKKYQVNDSIKSMITYGRLNLLAPWPMKGPFQVIMCRNVMIYFDKKTQQELVERFYELLEPGGYLFIGHSESVTNKEIGLRTVQPAAYQKIGV